jgi:hypothetical protein
MTAAILYDWLALCSTCLTNVGPGHWYSISTVSKLFKDCYERVETDVVLTDGYRSGLHADVITCVPQMTLYSSIFSSSSRVSLTHASGYGYFDDMFLDYFAGVHADQSTLQAAHELGLIRYSSDVLAGAARAGNLVKVMWLHEEQHCELGDHDQLFDESAVLGGSIAVLDWLKQQGVTPTGLCSIYSSKV